VVPKEAKMFAKQIQKDVKVGEDTVVVRKLSGKTLGKARGAKRADQVQSMRDIGADLIKAFQEGKKANDPKVQEVEVAAAVPEPTPEEMEKARKATFSDYDQEIVLNAGIVRWTAKEPVNADSIGDLDEESAKILFTAILDLSVSALDAAEVSGKG
jgi:hypothetical protein